MLPEKQITVILVKPLANGVENTWANRISPKTYIGGNSLVVVIRSSVNSSDMETVRRHLSKVMK
ncbi:TPA: hypothetical protein DIU27_02490 [Candidatus Collierbacteria bacterium]|nr:MAG: hypothetical protein UW42_C0010G0013 [Candidatus Collierbacteria bacterium GW2011_GWB1_44_197]HCQ31224.1 hypothetical protein [Candidatus Collierbacteria bacterium]